MGEDEDVVHEPVLDVRLDLLGEVDVAQREARRDAASALGERGAELREEERRLGRAGGERGEDEQVAVPVLNFNEFNFL